ncbi:MAG: ArnT family glycosyltransferase [Desertimonas sp.]
MPERAAHDEPVVGARIDLGEPRDRADGGARSGGESGVIGHRLELIVPACALAMFLVASGYATSRRGDDGAPLYWSGQLLLLVTVAVAVLAPRLDRVGRVGAVVAFTATQYAIKWMYSPRQVRFADELQHWQTTLGMLDSDRLFPTNTSLPISPVFPGLEALTVTVIRVTGLSFFPAAIVVCGLCTLAATGLVWCLAARLTSYPAVAALATLVYLCNPNHGFFSSMYLYVTPALAFLCLLTLGVVDLLAGRGAGRGNWWLGLTGGAALLVTHHVTVVIGLFGVIATAVTCSLVPAWRRPSARLRSLAVALVALTLFWAGWVATGAVNYVSGPVEQVVSTVTELGGPAEPADGPAAAVPSRPPVELVMSVAAIAVVSLALGAVGVALLVRRRTAAGLLAGVGSASMMLLLVGRGLGATGELVGRSFPYVTLGAALIGARSVDVLVRRVATGRRWSPSPSRTIVRLGAVMGLVVVGVGGITTGIPAFWQRLPGVFHAAGFESGVDVRTMDVAWWARANLEPGTRFVADLGNETTVGSIGNMQAVQEAAPLFYRAEFDEADAEWVRQLAVSMVVADQRLTDEPPVTGTYFSGDVEGDRYPDGVSFADPFPSAGLDKFAAMADVGRVYDDGVVRVYDLEGSRYEW